MVNYAWRSAKLHFTIDIFFFFFFDIELGLTIRRLLPAALLYCHHLLNYLIVSQSEVACWMGDYKHWTRDPRTGDPRTRGPEDRGPEDQGPNDLALLHLAFMTEMQLVSMF